VTTRRPVSEFVIRAPLTRDDLPGLSARVCRLLADEDPVIAFCNVGGFDEVDVVTVDALARLQLAARRHGCEIRLRAASARLCELVRLMGLEDVLPGLADADPTP
jgi:ABC-type transporter Mla MlaB component